MSPIQFTAVAFVCIIANAIGGALLRTRLPEHHVSSDSKDVIKLSIALVATMSALVLACSSPRPGPPSSAPAGW